ncbi:hypothetical protein ACSBR2_031034 [Camellia fascicularis]
MSYYASHANKDFEEAKEIAFQLTLQMKKRWSMRKEGNAEAGDRNIAPKLYGVGDANVMKTKGNPGGTSSMVKPLKPRRCGYCRYGASDTRSGRGSNSDSEPFMNIELDPHMDDIDELPNYPNDPV